MTTHFHVDYVDNGTHGKIWAHDLQQTLFHPHPGNIIEHAFMVARWNHDPGEIQGARGSYKEKTHQGNDGVVVGTVGSSSTLADLLASFLADPSKYDSKAIQMNNFQLEIDICMTDQLEAMNATSSLEPVLTSQNYLTLDYLNQYYQKIRSNLSPIARRLLPQPITKFVLVTYQDNKPVSMIVESNGRLSSLMELNIGTGSLYVDLSSISSDGSFTSRDEAVNWSRKAIKNAIRNDPYSSGYNILDCCEGRIHQVDEYVPESLMCSQFVNSGAQRLTRLYNIVTNSKITSDSEQFKKNVLDGLQILIDYNS